MKPELLERIEQIPMLPETVQKVEAVFQNPHATTHDMVKAIQSDPLLIARILKLANSPLYGLSRSVTDIAHAIALLGRDMVRTFVIASAANETIAIDLTPYGLTPDDYLNRAQLQNALASRWASKIDRQSLPYVSLGSYLLELGRVVISRYLLDTKQSEGFASAIHNGKGLKEMEVEYCGAKSEDVTATIFNHWKFQPDLIYVIRYANEPEDAADEELRTASKILKVCKEAVSSNGTFTDVSLAAARETLNELEMELAPFDEAVAKIQEAV